VQARPTFRGHPRRAMEPAESGPGHRPRKRLPADELEPGKRRSPDQ
jgi:hypothetical protein